MRSETSKFDDRTNVFLTTQSEEALSCRFNSGTATLVVRCLENTTSVVLVTGCHMADLGSYGKVEYRIDDRRASSVRMRESTDNKALGLWRGGQAIPFAKRLFGADRLLMRFTPYGESSMTASFDISGLEEAIKPLREACHW